MAIVFTIITCGIYGLYWLYQILTSYYRLNNRPSNAGMDIVLSIITCGIYSIYLSYKIGKLESDAYQHYGMPPKDDAILYLILTIFGFSIIAYAIVQSNINALVDHHNYSGPGPGHGHGGYNQQQPGNFQ
jgi:nitrate reductase NapE component